MTTLIFANGVVADYSWLDSYLDEATVVMAADGGAEHLAARGVRPDIVIGDMDSIAAAIRTQMEESGTRFLQFPRDKDETDLELALLHAVRAYEGDILIFGALGGRLDQTMGNVMLLAHPALAGRSVTLVEPEQQAWLVVDETQIRGSRGDIVSLIPISGDVRVHATSGLRWPLRDEVLAVGRARGISNQMTADVATVTVESGRLLCIHTRSGADERVAPLISE